MSEPTPPSHPTEPSTAPPAGQAPPPATPPPAAPGSTAPDTATPERDDPLRGSRTSGLWVTVIGLGLVLLLLIIFIAQNTQDVNVSFLGWDGRAPLAVALLIATVAGLFLAAVAGTLRIWQLRRRVRRGER
jgi:uncharacterized integral membrane protein